MEQGPAQKSTDLARLGEQCRLAGNYSAAVEHFDRAYPPGSKSAWGLAHRGAARTMLGDLDGAIDDLDASVALRDGYAWAQGWKGEALRLRARNRVASDLSVIIRDNLAPLGASAAAVGAVTRNVVLVHVMTDLGKSIAAFDAAVAGMPTSAWARAHRGAAHTFAYWIASTFPSSPEGPRADHAAKAAADFDVANELNHIYPWAKALQGLLFTIKGDLEKARAMVGDASLVDINHRLVVLRVLAELYSFSAKKPEDFDPSVRNGWLALQQEPEDFVARYYVAVGLKMGGKSFAPAVIADMRQRLLCLKSNIEEMLGGLAAVEGKTDEAVAALDHIQQHPDMDTLAILARDQAWNSLRDHEAYKRLFNLGLPIKHT